MPSADGEALRHIHRGEFDYSTHACGLGDGCHAFVQRWNLRPRRDKKERIDSFKRRLERRRIREIANEDFGTFAEPRVRLLKVSYKDAWPLATLDQHFGDS